MPNPPHALPAEALTPEALAAQRRRNCITGLLLAAVAIGFCLSVWGYRLMMAK